jgi:serine protease Do
MGKGKVILAICLAAAPFGMAQTASRIGVVSTDGCGYLGVQIRDVTPADVKDLNLPKETGVYIERVEPETPADKAGLAEKDVVIEYSGLLVLSVRQFQRMVADTPPGRTVEITVVRQGQTLRKSAEIKERESALGCLGERGFRIFSGGEGWGSSTPRGRDFRLEWIPEKLKDIEVLVRPRTRLGIRGVDLTEQMGEHLAVPGKEGVLVIEVTADSPAAKAGVKAGDVIVAVNGRSVENVSELTQKLGEGDQELDVIRDKKGLKLKAAIEPRGVRRTPVKAKEATKL